MGGRMSFWSRNEATNKTMGKEREELMSERDRMIKELKGEGICRLVEVDSYIYSSTRSALDSKFDELDGEKFNFKGRNCLARIPYIDKLIKENRERVDRLVEEVEGNSYCMGINYNMRDKKRGLVQKNNKLEKEVEVINRKLDLILKNLKLEFKSKETAVKEYTSRAKDSLVTTKGES